jgi:hypothetical protein
VYPRVLHHADGIHPWPTLPPIYLFFKSPLGPDSTDPGALAQNKSLGGGSVVRTRVRARLPRRAGSAGSADDVDWPIAERRERGEISKRRESALAHARPATAAPRNPISRLFHVSIRALTISRVKSAASRVARRGSSFSRTRVEFGLTEV